MWMESMIRRLVLVFAAPILFLGCGEAEDSAAAPNYAVVTGACGDTRSALQSQTSAVVNGSTSWSSSVVNLSAGQALAVGAILYRDLGWEHNCTATLIAEDVVLTAAHCVADEVTRVIESAADVRFAMGADMGSKDGVVNVSQVVVHTGFVVPMTGAAHDVALLILSEPATNEVPSVVPIEPNCNAVSLAGQDVQNVGYGCTDGDCYDYNDERLWVVQDVASATSSDFVVDGHGVSGVCFGDSGGPALWTVPEMGIRVMGVLSWGDPDCTHQDHFTATNNECDFIDDHVDLTPVVSCVDIDPLGECSGNLLTYCLGDTMYNVDCAANDRVCGTDSTGQKGCLDSCMGETSDGRCDGQNAVWCEGGQVRTRRCAECGQSCGWSDSHSGFYCL